MDTTNAALLARRHAAVPRALTHATPAFASRARNAEIWDVEGRRYVDFAGGIAVLNTGHCHPKVIAAATEQMGRFTHTCVQVLAYEPYVALAERLNALAPFSGPARTIFFTTGAEAVENAVKIARAATGRSGIIAFAGGFHGRTIMTSAMTGKLCPTSAASARFRPRSTIVPFPIEHHGVTTADSLKALEFLFRADIEPSPGRGHLSSSRCRAKAGSTRRPRNCWWRCASICDQHGILLVSRRGAIRLRPHRQDVRHRA